MNYDYMIPQIVIDEILVIIINIYINIYNSLVSIVALLNCSELNLVFYLKLSKFLQIIIIQGIVN